MILTVLQFQCLNKVAVPDHALVSELEVVHILPQGVHLLDTLPHDRAITEDGSVVLHGLLHGQPDGGGVDVALLEPQLVNVGHARLSSVVGDGLDGLSGLVIGGDGLCTGAAKDDQVEEAVSAQPRQHQWSFAFTEFSVFSKYLLAPWTELEPTSPAA